MSDTPRTENAINAEATNREHRWLRVCDCARQLERELNKVKGDCEAWNRAYHEEKKRVAELENAISVANL